MADIDELLPFILKWEGKFVNDPDDRGGATNMGVTLNTWRNVGYDIDGDGDIDVDDLKRLTTQEVRDKVLKPYYWDRWKADNILSQKIANMLVDWVWCSGRHGIVIPQKILGVKPDGIVGPQTIQAVNSFNPSELHPRLYAERSVFLHDIALKGNNKKFLNGWLNRLEDLK